MNLRARLATLSTLVTLAALVAGCSSSSTSPPPAAIAFSDVHFDPFFDPALLDQLESRPVSEWASVFASSGIADPGHYEGTTNAVLLQRALAALQAQQPPPALVIFGGDLLVQDFAVVYRLLRPAADEAALRAFALKTVTFVVQQVRAALGTTPVYFTLGNWDNFVGSFGLEPDDPFLAGTAALFYDGFLGGTTDRQAFEATYRSGGYYAAQLPGSALVVIGLNTNFLSPLAPAGIEAAVAEELDWLDATLTLLRATGRRAWIVMHVPPGGDLATTGGTVTPQGQIPAPTMMLQPGPQERLLTILDAHREIVAAAFTGHTHMDEYRLAAIPMQGIPGITAIMGNAPAFKVFTLGSGAGLQDYLSWNLDLSVATASFQPYYDFSVAYGLAGPLSSALPDLALELAVSSTAEASYRGFYGSGHAPGKPVTDLNWPVYRCGISFMTAQGLQDCVNQR